MKIILPILFFAILITSFITVQPVNATVPVITTQFFTFPSTNVNFNFSENLTLADGYRESTSNDTFSEYWFLTKTTGEIFGFYSLLTNFTITDFYTSNQIVISPEQTGTITVYYGALTEPVVTGAIASNDATLKLMTITSAGNPVTLTWASVPTPTPIFSGGDGGGVTPTDPTPTPLVSNSPSSTVTPTAGPISPNLINNSLVVPLVIISIIFILVLAIFSEETERKKKRMSKLP